MMKVFHRLNVMVFLFTMSLLAGYAWSAEELLLDKAVGRYQYIGPFIDFIEQGDGDDDVSLQKISSRLSEFTFFTSDAKIPNLGFQSQPLWLRITVRSKAQTSTRWILDIANNRLDDIKIYFPRPEGGYRRVNTGSRLAYAEREIPYRNFATGFDLPPDIAFTLFIRIDSETSMRLPINLWHEQQFNKNIQMRYLFDGSYFGILLAMLIANAFGYLTLGDRSYLYYSLFVFSMITAQFISLGLAAQYLWPATPWWSQHSLIASVFILVFFGSLFTQSFLRLKDFFPPLNRLFCLFSLFILCAIVVTWFITMETLLFVMRIAVGAFLLLAISASILSLRSGFRPARYYFIAWLCLLSAMVFFIIVSTLKLSLNFDHFIPVQIASALEAILLSMGLMDRYNLMKQEKDKAQKLAVENLRKSEKLKDDFIIAISHELRTPMNAISGGLQVLKSPAEEQSQALIKIIQDGTEQMNTLIDDILTYAELQFDKARVHAEICDFYQLLESLNIRGNDLSKNKGLQWKWHIDSNVPQWIIIDARKVHNIIHKLVDNAVKYTSRGEVSVHIGFLIDDAASNTAICRLQIAVEDHGIGISKQQESEIFSPFVQSEGGFKRSHGGIGIGLSIIKSMLDLLQGDIDLQSELGKGSVFSLTIPVKRVAQQSELEEDSPPELAESGVVLVVEDNIINQKIIQKMLENIGLISAVANNGKEALALLNDQAFALILMDLQMPVMDGFTCTKKIRHSQCAYKNIPIIAVTANLMEADKEMCIQSGMNDYLGKPINLSQLKSSIKRFLSI